MVACESGNTPRRWDAMYMDLGGAIYVFAGEWTTT